MWNCWLLNKFVSISMWAMNRTLRWFNPDSPLRTFKICEPLKIVICCSPSSKYMNRSFMQNNDPWTILISHFTAFQRLTLHTKYSFCRTFSITGSYLGPLLWKSYEFTFHRHRLESDFLRFLTTWFNYVVESPTYLNFRVTDRAREMENLMNYMLIWN